MANWKKASGPTQKTAMFIRTECPYFVRDEKSDIVCEGIGEREKLITRFTRMNDKKSHAECFCYSIKNYKNCPVAFLHDYMEGE